MLEKYPFLYIIKNPVWKRITYWTLAENWTLANHRATHMSGKAFSLPFLIKNDELVQEDWMDRVVLLLLMTELRWKIGTVRSPTPGQSSNQRQDVDRFVQR